MKPAASPDARAAAPTSITARRGTYGVGSRMIVAERKKPERPTLNARQLESQTLLKLCRTVLVAHFERYPPNMFSICGEDEWDELVKVRHELTKPKDGTGGLDGSGRVAPALSERFVNAVETENPHLAQSSVTDNLIWRDCTEFRFSRGGISRPLGLQLPWPVLVEQVQENGQLLQYLCSANEDTTEESSDSLRQLVGTLYSTPMNVSLLQATGIGKTLKKSVKALTKSNIESATRARLEKLLQSWMMLASDVTGKAGKDTILESCSASVHADLCAVEACQTWRELFAVLREREESRRSSQGQRMRQIRKNLAADRPKVVKVRTVSSKQQRILSGDTNFRGNPTSKIAQVRREAAISRQIRNASPANRVKPVSSFGAAVALSGGAAKKGMKRKPPPSTVHKLGGGKRLTVPAIAKSRPFQLGDRKR